MMYCCVLFIGLTGLRPSNCKVPEGKEASDLRLKTRDVMIVARKGRLVGRTPISWGRGMELLDRDSIEHIMMLVVDTKTGVNMKACWVPVEPGTAFGRMLGVAMFDFAKNANLEPEQVLFSRNSMNGGACKRPVQNSDGTYSLEAPGNPRFMRRSDPAKELKNVALRMGLPGSFSLGVGRISYATVSEVRHSLANGTLRATRSDDTAEWTAGDLNEEEDPGDDKATSS